MTLKVVLAGNYRQYENYLRESNQTRQQAVYAGTSDHLRGLRNVEIVHYGTWYENKQYDQHILSLVNHDISTGRLQGVPQ